MLPLLLVISPFLILVVLIGCGGGSKPSESNQKSNDSAATNADSTARSKQMSVTLPATPCSAQTPASKNATPHNKSTSFQVDMGQVGVERQVPTEPECPKSRQKLQPSNNLNPEGTQQSYEAASLQAQSRKKNSASLQTQSRKRDDSFEQLQPQKRDAKRAAQIRGCLVPNQGDYKTWNKQMETDFSKSIEGGARSNRQ